ncbi:MAG: serine/threonine protein kinase [Myxococcota bacterium]|nr:serine/threonine protein kinase [Myxococcota bacterium]
MLRPLASGGMATVFLGRLSGMAGFEKLVAIKVIHPHLIEQQEFVEMFLDEARLSARIHHPNVVEIFEVGEEEGLYFMVAELVRGRSLREMMSAASRTGQSLTPPTFLTILAKVCDALHAAHTLKAPDGSPLGMVHRDISPSNILVSFDGFVKLIDFGIAFAEGRITTTRTGVVKGKYGYLAPEQLTGDPADRRIDIFSLGVVMYKVATGTHPFPGATERERVHNLLYNPPTPPHKVVPGIDPALEQVILKAMAKEPENRHQTADDLGQEIGDLLVNQGGLLRSQDLADLMSRLFGDEIAKDAETLEQAMRPEADDDPRWSRDDNRQKVGLGLKEGRNTLRLKNPPPPVTEQVESLPPERTKKRWRRRMVLAAVSGVAAVASLGMFLWSDPLGRVYVDGHPRENEGTASQTEAGGESSALASPSTDADLAPQAEPVPTLAQPDSMQAGVPTSSAPKLDGTDTASAGNPLVQILLKGVPASAEVMLGGKDAALVDGKLAVPGDGKQRELRVSLKGYLPYRQTIAPDKDGELTVKLIKKRGAQWTTDQNKEKNNKATRKKLMECPYCDP